MERVAKGRPEEDGMGRVIAGGGWKGAELAIPIDQQSINPV